MALTNFKGIHKHEKCAKIQPCLPDTLECDSLTKVTNSTTVIDVTPYNVPRVSGSLLLATQRERLFQCVQFREWAPEQLLKSNNTWRCGVGMGWRGKTEKMAGRKRQQLTVSSQDSFYLLLPRRTPGTLPEQWHIAHCIPESPKARHSRSQGSEFQSSRHILPRRKGQRAEGTSVSVTEMKETRCSPFVCLPEIILPLTWNLLAPEKLQSATVVIFIRAVDDRIMTVAVLCAPAGATSSHLLSLP